jgi:Myb-like DNA-binding domain
MGMVNHYPLSEVADGSTNLVLIDSTSDGQDERKSLPLDILHNGRRVHLPQDAETKNVDALRYNGYASELNMTSTCPNLQPKSIGNKPHGFSTSNGTHLIPSKKLHGLLDNDDADASNNSHLDATTSGGQSSDQRIGRWTLDEKVLFLYGLQKFGKGRWKKISLYVPGRYVVRADVRSERVLSCISLIFLTVELT